MNKADNSVNIYACNAATSSSRVNMNIINGTDTKEMASDFKMNISDTKLKIKMWPAVMLANKRSNRANGLVNTPMISTGHMIGYIHFGTCGKKMWLQYVFVPLTLVMMRVKMANTAVKAMLPDMLDAPGKKGTRPIMLLIQIKKNTVSK